jgi:hypothetical protein
MAKGNVKIVDSAGYNSIPTYKWQTEANATAIYAGEPVKLKVTGAAGPYVIPLADAEPVAGTTSTFIGIAATDSTHTASADGSIEVYMPLPGVVYECLATTASTADTEAEILALAGKQVKFDLISSEYTVNAAEATALTAGLIIVGGDPLKSSLKFVVLNRCTIFGVTV